MLSLEWKPRADEVAKEFYLVRTYVGNVNVLIIGSSAAALYNIFTEVYSGIN